MNGGGMALVGRFGSYILAVILMTGCASNDLMIKRQSETEAKIEHLVQSQKLNLQSINEFSGQLRSCEEQGRNAAEQIKGLQAAVQELKKANEELKARLESPQSANKNQKIEIVNAEPATKGKDSGPPAAYVKAFGLYSANNFSAAITAFEQFIKRFPKSDYAANSYYWIGECYYSQSDLEKAVASFRKTVELYPRSSKAPDALLKWGYALLAGKDKVRAQQVFEKLVKTYPGSMAAVKAREKLTAK